MTRSKAIIPFIKLVFKDYRGLLKALLNYTKEADKKYYARNKFNLKNGLPFVDINELIPNLNEEIISYTYLDGNSRITDIALLKAICKNYVDCNYLEIGSWRGESLINVSQVAKKCTSISLSKEEIIRKGMSKRTAELQGLFTNAIANINHIEHDSFTFDFKSLNEKFDVIFIDGDHSYDGVKSDTLNAFKLLKDDRSVIIWHDCGGGYEGFRYEVISAILDGCHSEKRKNIYRISNSICGIYTQQKVNSEHLTSPQIPNKTFTVNIKSFPYDAQ